MELNDLVDMARINAKFHSLAKNVFKRIYSHHIRITQLHSAPRIFSQHKELDWKEFDGILQINDYELTLNILHYFGDVIERFEIERDGTESMTLEALCMNLNKYCALSLVRLDLGMFKSDCLEILNGPFTNLEEFTFDTSYKMVTKTLSLGEKFPKLRRLTLTNWNRQNALIILDGHLPHLEYLNIESSTGSERQAFDNFLKQNPTIRHIEVTGFPKDYIKTIHQLLPNLKHLTIGSGYTRGRCEIDDPIHFEHLKVLHYRTYRPKSLTKISFSHLEELLIYYDSDSFNRWIEFFGMNQTFTRFYVHADFDAIDFELNIQQIIDALPPSVVDITINCYSGLETETIARVVRSRDNLFKFQFSTKEDFDDLDVLRATFEEKWDITIPPSKNSWNQLLFVSKHSFTSK